MKFIVGFILGFVDNNKNTDNLPNPSIRSVSALTLMQWRTVGVWVSVKFNYMVYQGVYLWLYLHPHPPVVWHNMFYSINDELFHMLYITAGVCLQLYAYGFVMSRCLCIHSVHENCYCVPRHCLQLLQNNTNKMLCGPPCLPFQTQTSVPFGQ